MRVWKWIGVAGVAGVAATGVAVARHERVRRAYTPDDVRARLHERSQEIQDDAAVSEPAEPGLVKRALRRLHLADGS